MSDKQSTWTGLWHELQRRHVVRVTLGYAAVAFVVLQMGEIILPAFTDNPAMMQTLVVVAALLFPVVIMLAWVYEVTPKGIRRMAEIDDETGHVDDLMPVFPRLVLLMITLVVVGAAGWWVVGTGLPQSADQANAASGLPLPVQPALATYNPDEPIRSLAVLALDNFTASDEQDFFAASLHEAIVAQLSQLPAVRVVSRRSVMRYAGTNTSNQQIGAELGVDAVVEGSVARSGDQVRVTLSLVDAASETTIWTESYDGELSDVLDLQRQISEAVAIAIQGELLPEERQTLMSYRDMSDDMEANEEMMRGRSAADSGTEVDLKMAEEHFSHAMEMDPEFAPAYAEQARVQIQLGMLESDTAAFLDFLPKARALAEQAIKLDSESPQVQAVWHFLNGLSSDVALEVGPTRPVIPAPEGVEVASGVAVTSGQNVLVLTPGQLADSIGRVLVASQTALGRRLERQFGEWTVSSGWGGNPRSREAAVHAAESMAHSGQTREALDLLRRMRQRSPDFVASWDATERILADEGRYDDIVELRWARVDALSEDVDEVEDLQEDIEDDGAEGYWEWRFEELSDLMEEGEAISHVDLALAYLQMGDEEGALDHLEEAAHMRDERLARERNNPAFDELRSEPRFRKLMAGLNRMMAPRRGPRRGGTSRPGRSGNGPF